ncbi:hypothetical protein NDU88_004155 [Pleurodeles waltl]|uniref:Uncharacterized protein n=1 Tax=Pleurodeles waltl TaxID=8319 RepID=A0AAV7UG31_PLEWA|nr:hypothetical protein NDU88_004155 [Pleurodeles waltl]
MPSPLLGKVADTPELDPSMATFLRKFAKDPKKGLDRAWKGYQDKLLDVSGPLTKIFDLAIQSKETETPLDTEAILQWAQRAICLLGVDSGFLCKCGRELRIGVYAVVFRVSALKCGKIKSSLNTFLVRAF